MAGCQRECLRHQHVLVWFTFKARGDIRFLGIKWVNKARLIFCVKTSDGLVFFVLRCGFSVDLNTDVRLKWAYSLSGHPKL